MRKISILFILFFILGGLVIYQNFFFDKTSEVETGFPVPGSQNNLIFVADQRPSSTTIINLVELNKNGYVVIHEDNQGRFGQIIGGTKLLPKGKSINITANLTRQTVDGEVLYAVMHEDSGDGIFSPNLDGPVLDEEGNAMFMRFYIDWNAPEIEGQEVMVDHQLPSAEKECRATGCSGQICADEDVATTCEFLKEYTCYKTARCERQSDGQCGWTMSNELKSCLDKNR